ncbi:hypothetical protein [Gulosibacter molinativorax]|uniref:DUF3592 domain-containing protein n=1 Tax=Gulosibacter molinativorax TaxID=256821 RepID=A0ABT7C6C8_9MICO|nr:hypothetical protein [Gulosibacter molinativorax]MDJ1370362.1 hypothetical protein [Gulosibacter molinativorax]QUY61275.1 Hypotetical protein [Gulosibacter molinativorax]
MRRILGFVGIALVVAGLTCFVIEIIGAFRVERMPAWYLPLWSLVFVAGIVLIRIASRQTTRIVDEKYPALSAPATVAAVTFAREDDDHGRYFNIDFVVHPDGQPSYDYRHQRILNADQQREWKPGKVVAVRRIYGGKGTMEIDKSPSALTKARIQNDPTLADRRTVEVRSFEVETPAPSREGTRGANAVVLVAVALGLAASFLAFPRFLPMIAESMFGGVGSESKNQQGLFAEGGLEDAADRLAPYVEDDVYRIQIDGNYILTLSDQAEPGTTKVDTVTLRGDRIYGPSPQAFRPDAIADENLVRLESVRWDVLPEALDECERHYEDPSASRENVTGAAHNGEILWTAYYSGDYGTFSCAISAEGVLLG